MTYIEGFVAAVPTAGREAYGAHASAFAGILGEFGAVRMVETWGDDVPDGKLTDFRKAVQAREDETIVFSWFEYPDRATRDAANARLRTDPRMEAMAKDMPFDGKRLIFGGFASLVDEAGKGDTGYVDGFVLPVPQEKKADYRAMAERMAAYFVRCGATRVVEAWGDDVPEGKVTDFRRAVLAQEAESVVFSFIQWPDKATRDAGWGRMMAEDPEKGTPMPFDGKRMFWGGFLPMLDTAWS